MNQPQAGDSPGWECIWADESAVPQYWRTPERAVVEWAHSLGPNAQCLLDLGCGVGRNTTPLARIIPHVIASDIAPSGLRACAGRMRQIGLTPRLVCHNVLGLPFASSSFDALLSFNVIYHATRPGLRAILAEIRRVLRPDSPVFLTFVGRVEENMAFYRSEVKRGVCQEIEPFTFIYIRDAFEDKYLPHHYSDEEEVRQFMSDFEIESLTPVLNEFTDEEGIDHVSLHYHVQARRP